MGGMGPSSSFAGILTSIKVQVVIIYYHHRWSLRGAMFQSGGPTASRLLQAKKALLRFLRGPDTCQGWSN